jgi:hypothetical protein
VRYPDLFLINEAWMKAERFERAVQREQLLNLYRASKADSWRYRAARFLLKLAERLEPSLKRDDNLPSPESC